MCLPRQNRAIPTWKRNSGSPWQPTLLSGRMERRVNQKNRGWKKSRDQLSRTPDITLGVRGGGGGAQRKEKQRGWWRLLSAYSIISPRRLCAGEIYIPEMRSGRIHFSIQRGKKWRKKGKEELRPLSTLDCVGYVYWLLGNDQGNFLKKFLNM